MSLIFEGLYKSYHDKMVLANISGGISNGEKIGFIGSNGIGKTTLSRILAGVEIPDKGNIEYTPHHALIIYLQQYPDFQPGASVYEELYQAVSKNSGINESVGTIVKKIAQSNGNLRIFVGEASNKFKRRGKNETHALQSPYKRF